MRISNKYIINHPIITYNIVKSIEVRSYWLIKNTEYVRINFIIYLNKNIISLVISLMSISATKYQSNRDVVGDN